MNKFDGWILKNPHGSLLIWSAAWRRKGVASRINELGGDWEDSKKQGCKIVKVKLIEVKE